VWPPLTPQTATPMQLDAPSKMLSVENASVVPPGEQKVVVHDAVLSLKGGNGLGIIGPTASGKSSLARLIVGVWAPARGSVRLDRAALDQWATDALGRHIGHLPH